MTTGIAGLHHNAYRCRDSEETRRFYEDFLGLPLACTLAIETSKTGRPIRALHTFYEMDDGSYLAFFDVRFIESYACTSWGTILAPRRTLSSSIDVALRFRNHHEGVRAWLFRSFVIVPMPTEVDCRRIVRTRTMHHDDRLAVRLRMASSYAALTGLPTIANI